MFIREYRVEKKDQWLTCIELDIIQDSAEYMTGEEYQNLVKKNQEILRNPRYGNTECGVSSSGIQNPMDICFKGFFDIF